MLHCACRAIAGKTVKVGNFSYPNQTKLSLHTLCRYRCSTVGKRDVWHGGQTESQGGKMGKCFCADSGTTNMQQWKRLHDLNVQKCPGWVEQKGSYFRLLCGTKCSTIAHTRSVSEPFDRSARMWCFNCSCCRSRPFVVVIRDCRTPPRNAGTHL